MSYIISSNEETFQGTRICNTDERITLIKNGRGRQHLHGDDNDIFCKTLCERYVHRPQNLTPMCLAEFAANYRPKYGSSNDATVNDDGDDVLPSEDVNPAPVTTITLTDNYGSMAKRKREAAIRFHKWSKDTDSNNWYRTQIMLYYHWRNEESDLLGGYDTYEEHYRQIVSEITTNEKKYTVEEVEHIDFHDDPPQHVWDSIAPTTEHNRGCDHDEGTTNLRDLEREDIAEMSNNNDDQCSSTHTSAILSRFDIAVNSDIIPPEEYRSLFRGLNKKQREIILFHRKWCKQTAIALRQ